LKKRFYASYIKIKYGCKRFTASMVDYYALTSCTGGLEFKSLTGQILYRGFTTVSIAMLVPFFLGAM